MAHEHCPQLKKTITCIQESLNFQCYIGLCVYLFYAPHLYADNNPLTYVLSTAKLDVAGHRWVGELADFRFSIKYRPGKVNMDADTLFRLPLDIDTYVGKELDRDAVRAA